MERPSEDLAEVFPGGPQPPHHQRAQRADALPRYGRPAGDAPHAQPSEGEDLPHRHEVKEPDAEKHVQIGQIRESDRVKIDGRVERRKSLEERGPPRRDAERNLGKPRAKCDIMFHVMTRVAAAKPNLNARVRMNPGIVLPSRSSPAMSAATCASGYTSRSYSTHCRRRITIRHIEANANAPTRAIHQVNGPAQAPRGICRSLDGRPSNSIRIVPPRFDGAIQSGIWRWKKALHWFSGVAR